MKVVMLAFSLWATISSASTGTSSPGAHSLVKDFAQTKQEIEVADLKQRQILSALYQINKKIKKAVTEKSVYSQQRAILEINVQSLSQKIAEIDQRTKSQRALLSERLRAIYKLSGGAALVRFLFAAESSAMLDKNLKILGIVASRDVQLIKNYREDSIDLHEKRHDLAKRLTHLKKIEDKLAAQELQFRKELDLKGKILDKVRKSKLFALNKIQGLREKTIEFNIEDEGLLDVLFKPSFGDQKGLLPSPTSGVITKKFGLIKGKDHPYTLSQKGVFIAAANGAPVKSIFDGKVSFAGDLAGFGKTLIVDHGDHYYTVYSHTQEVKVKVGDEVSQSHILAQVGEDPTSGATGLYFEIRHFSEPYDPQQWMKGL